MQEIIKKYLGKLEGMVDPKWQNQTRETVHKVFNFEEVDELPYLNFNEKDATLLADKDWPSYPYNDAFDDPAKMLLSQLTLVLKHIQLRDYHALNIRCNYGTVILPSVFGAKYSLTENSMPWSAHYESREEIKELIARGIPDLETGLGKKCFETAEFYKKTLAAYPKLKKAISIYHPDLQSTFDVAHLLWGHDLMYAMYDCPELVHESLSLITKTYAEFMRRWQKITGEGNDHSTHWGYYMKGGIFLRDDSAVMISPAQYDEFVKPYDQELLNEFGGCIHFCGKGDTFIKSMTESKNLSGINTSQPDLNNMDVMRKYCSANKVVLVGLLEKFVPKDAKTGYIVIKQDNYVSTR